MKTLNPSLVQYGQDELLINFYKFWETANPELLEKSVSKDVIDHDRNPQLPGTDYEAMLAQAQSFGGLSDMEHELEQVHYLGDGKIVVRWVCKAKHTGDVMGKPRTGNNVAFHGHDILQTTNGKIVELWHIEELLQMMGQL